MMIHRAFSYVVLLALTFGLAIAFIACASGDKPLEVVDPNAAPLDPDFELVFNIIQNECTPCHDDREDEGESDRVFGGGPSRGGGVEPPLETCDDIYNYRFDIWSEIDQNTMPTGAWPRLSEVEKLIVKRWLDNGATVPCR